MSDPDIIPADAMRILRFWFGDNALGAPEHRPQWFGKDAELDAGIKNHFLSLYRQGVAGELESWQRAPAGALAYTILFDQFPRNMFRATPQSFASDAKALASAKAAVAAGFDNQVPPLARVFFYLPFEHSEALADQQRSLSLFGLLEQYADLESFVDYARRHAAVIERFGRFPHRNALLERTDTADEEDFLRQPGSVF